MKILEEVHRVFRNGIKEQSGEKKMGGLAANLHFIKVLREKFKISLQRFFVDFQDKSS